MTEAVTEQRKSSFFSNADLILRNSNLLALERIEKQFKRVAGTTTVRRTDIAGMGGILKCLNRTSVSELKIFFSF